jgi:hypothetical protein
VQPLLIDCFFILRILILIIQEKVFFTETMINNFFALILYFRLEFILNNFLQNMLNFLDFKLLISDNLFVLVSELLISISLLVNLIHSLVQLSHSIFQFKFISQVLCLVAVRSIIMLPAQVLIVLDSLCIFLKFLRCFTSKINQDILNLTVIFKYFLFQFFFDFHEFTELFIAYDNLICMMLIL